MVKPKKRVCAYVRVSDGKDAMLHSISAQVSYYSNYIQNNHEWEFAGIYVDKAITGTKQDRELFQKMLDDCRKGKIDIIITKSISRFARNTVTMLETVRELKLLCIDVYFEKENIHSISGDGELMLTILSSYAQEESRSVSENCKWHIRKKFQEGKPANWNFMYGYIISKDKIEINEKEADIVRSIFNDYINGISTSKIAKSLEDRKAPTLRGGNWSANRVLSILRNEKYSGNSLLQKKFVENHLNKKLVINKGELPRYYAENTHLAIIDTDTFNMAKAIRESRRIKNAGKKPQNKYPFSGMIKCAKCGKSYRRVTNKSGHAWNCITYINKGKSYCHTKQIPEDILYKLTCEVLGTDIFSESKFKQQIKHIIIPKFNHITYILNDGTEISKTWQDKSRSESWTPEMRESARQRQQKIIEERK